MHAEFLAAVQLVVYAGGTLILIIFGVMLTSKSPFSQLTGRSRIEVPWLCVIGLVVLMVAWRDGDQARAVCVATAAGGRRCTRWTSWAQALLGDYLVPV